MSTIMPGGDLASSTMPDPSAGARTLRSAKFALGLLIAINLVDFIDRYLVASVEPAIRATFFRPDDPHAMARTGTLGTAFVVSYLMAAPVLGWLADRYSRWLITGIAVIAWSLGCTGSGLAITFAILFVTRIIVGIGEGAYSPTTPTIVADLFPFEQRGRVMSIFFAAIPVGSALGYVVGELFESHWGWRSAFYFMGGVGLILAIFCFFQTDTRSAARNQIRYRATFADYLRLLRTRSYVFNLLGQTAMVFSLGGIAFWMPAYLQFRHQPSSATATLGIIVAIAGLISTIAGGFLADRLQPRIPGAYLLVPGFGMLAGFPFILAMIYAPFPYAWLCLFAGLLLIFLNVSPVNTAVANVSTPLVRATAYAVAIFVVHGLGDSVAPPALGAVADRTNLNYAFGLATLVMILAAAFWIYGAKFLAADTAAVGESARISPTNP